MSSETDPATSSEIVPVMPSEIDPARIRSALEAVFPTRSLDFLLSRGATLVACVVGITLTGLGSVVLVAWWVDLDFQPTWIPYILTASFVLAWVVGTYCPPQEALGESLKSEEPEGLGVAGVVLGAMAQGLVCSTRDLSGPPVFEPRQLDIGAALVRACLDQPGIHREELVATVVRAGSGYQQTEVEFVLIRLQRKKMLRGRQGTSVSNDLVQTLTVGG